MYSCEKQNNCACLALITAIVAGLFLVALGLILGATFSTFFTTNLSALVVLAIVLFVMTAVLLIYKLCIKCNR